MATLLFLVPMLFQLAVALEDIDVPRNYLCGRYGHMSKVDPPPQAFYCFLLIQSLKMGRQYLYIRWETVKIRYQQQQYSKRYCYLLVIVVIF